MPLSFRPHQAPTHRGAVVLECTLRAAETSDPNGPGAHTNACRQAYREGRRAREAWDAFQTADASGNAGNVGGTNVGNGTSNSNGAFRPPNPDLSGAAFCESAFGQKGLEAVRDCRAGFALDQRGSAVAYCRTRKL